MNDESPLKNEIDFDRRNLDIQSHPLALEKDKTLKQRDFGVTKLYQVKAMKIKDIIKSEVDVELKNLVDLAIEKHSKIVSINQIQRVPDNKIDAFKNELKGLKDLMSDFVKREQDMTDRFHKFDKMVPEFNLKINNL